MIQAESLSMWYGNVRALHDASFDVRSGEVLGLLGPNGAGKSTTLKILTTYLQPTSGRVVVDGIDAAEDPISVREKIGYLPETTPLYVDMLVSEYLGFVAEARGLSGNAVGDRRDAVVTACGLEPQYNRPIGHLSKGYRQRVGLAQALIHDPEILILDEPTSGLDPLQIIGIRKLIRDLSKTKTILFSTHILQEIAAVSDRVMIVNEGRMVVQATPTELEQSAMRQDRLVVEVHGPEDDVGRALADVEGARQVEPTTAETDDGAAFHVRHDFGDESVRRGVEEAVRSGGWPLARLATDRYTLEEVFIELTSGGAQPAPADEQAAAAAGGAA